VDYAPPEIDMAELYLLQCRRTTARKQREQMEFTTDWIFDRRQLEKPAFQVTGAHSGIATLLFVPVNCVGRIVGRQRLVGLAGMIVDGT
jgi:hypothetical protein